MLPPGEYVPEVGEEVLVIDHLGTFLVEEIDVEQKTAVLRSTQSQEFCMSARKGDKSRFNRVRKQKIARRKRIQQLLHQQQKHADQRRPQPEPPR
jgi:hypothetical protein